MQNKDKFLSSSTINDLQQKKLKYNILLNDSSHKIYKIIKKYKLLNNNFKNNDNHSK